MCEPQNLKTFLRSLFFLRSNAPYPRAPTMHPRFSSTARLAPAGRCEGRLVLLVVARGELPEAHLPLWDLLSLLWLRLLEDGERR